MFTFKKNLPYIGAFLLVLLLWALAVHHNAQETERSGIALQDSDQAALRIDMRQTDKGLQMRVVDTQYGMYCIGVSAADVPLSCVQIQGIDMRSPLMFNWEAERPFK